MIVPARDGPTPPGDHPALLIPHYHHPSCPPSIIEYVVVHELATCTGIIASESWRRVERSMPDFQCRKEWLARQWGRITI